MKAWIISNKFFISKSFLDLKNIFFKSFKDYNIDVEEYNNLDVIKILSKNNYKKPDFVLFWDKDVKLASYIESEGIKVFNSSESIRLCDDKSLTYLKLKNKGIKMPKTIFSPLLYYHTAVEDNDFLDFTIEKLGLPLVFKECFGSFGKQVYLINSKDELIDKIKEVVTWPYIMQEFVKSSFGRDLRLYVVGDEVVASMNRVNTLGDFRANIEVGSSGSNYNANENQIEMAINVTKNLGLDFAGIDILFGKDDEPIFCEANSNAYFNEINKVANINIADYIIDHILTKI